MVRPIETTLFRILLAISLLVSAGLTAEEDSQVRRLTPLDRVIGLVEVPKLYPPESDMGEPPKPAVKPQKVKLYSEPRKTSNVKMTIDGSKVITREHAYEISSAVVFQRKGDWYLIKTDEDEGWLSPQDAGEFRSYESLIGGYLTQSWTGRLWESLNKKAKSWPVKGVKFEESGGSEGWG